MPVPEPDVRDDRPGRRGRTPLFEQGHRRRPGTRAGAATYASTLPDEPPGRVEGPPVSGRRPSAARANGRLLAELGARCQDPARSAVRRRPARDVQDGARRFTVATPVTRFRRSLSCADCRGRSAAAAASGQPAPPEQALQAKVAGSWPQVPLIDGHNDLPEQLPRARRRTTSTGSTSRRHAASSTDAAAHRHPAPCARGSRRPVLVGVRAHHARGPVGRPGGVRADRPRSPHDRPLPRDLRDGRHRGRRRAHPPVGQDRLPDRHGGRPLDRQLARRAAPGVRAAARAT